MRPPAVRSDLDAVLTKAKGLVVAAAGDGTVRAVVTRLIGKGLPIAVLPLGTANNIWNTLASQMPVPATVQEILAGLRTPSGATSTSAMYAALGEKIIS
jgi:diacylglycerol kinase family enzyme